MKGKCLILLIFLFSQANAQIVSFSSGETINKTAIVSNFNYLKDKLNTEKYFNITEDYSIDSTNIKSNDFNTIISNFNTLLGGNVSLINSGESIIAVNINQKFQEINSLIDSYSYISCKDLLTKQPHLLNNNGEYNIKPDGVNEYTVYCDMSYDGGGWTRIDSNLATSNVGYQSNNYSIRARNKGVACSTYSVSAQISNIKINDFTLVRDDFNRTTITQCPRLQYSSSEGSAGYAQEYKNSSGNYVNLAITCGWAYQNGSSVWDSNSSISLGTNDARDIRLVREFLPNRNRVQFTSRCSDSSDNGFVTHNFFVK